MSSYAKNNSRRSHRKSRLGCGNCKARRVKPSCLKCSNHGIECDYSHLQPTSEQRNEASTPRPPSGHSQMVFISSSQSRFGIPKRRRQRSDKAKALSSSPSSPSSSTSPADSAVAVRPFEFTVTDMALFHHCLSAEELKNYLSPDHMRLAFSFHFLLRLILAVSGFHMKRKPETSHLRSVLQPDIDVFSEAERHVETAIQMVAAAGPNLNETNSHAIYAASVYIFICYLAKGPQPGEYLAFREDDDTPGLSFFKGVRTIHEACKNLGLSQQASVVHSTTEEHTSEEDEATLEHQQGGSLGNEESFHDYSEPLRELRALIFSTFPATDDRCFSYSLALDSLIARFDSVFGGSAPLAGLELWPQIFSWLYTLPDCVVWDMEEKYSLALLLFAFFLPLLDQLSSAWLIQGWPCHIMDGISRNIEESHRRLLSWPLSRLKLRPSNHRF